MAYLPAYRCDVFLSYPHLSDWDNWVSDFHRQFEGALTDVLGEPATVWRDARLRATHLFDEEILSQVKGAGLFLAIASPSREASEWCARELEEFRAAADRKLGFRIGNLQRAAVVAKIPAPERRHREILPRGLCVEFFDGDPLSFNELPFGSPEYKNRLSRLAQDAAAVLVELRKLLTVYLAGTSRDVRPLFEKIYRELIDREFGIRPTAWLEKLDGDDFTREWLAECGLSVHILGSAYHEYTVRQFHLARELKVPQAVWIPPGIQFHAEQERWLADLRKNPSGVDLLEGKSLDSVKDFLLEKLRRPSGAPVQRPAAQRGIVYLACSPEDHPYTKPGENAQRILDHLFKLGFEVDTPVTGEVPSRRIRADAMEKLLACDGLIVYWGQAEHSFVEEMKSLWRKAAAKRPSREYRSKLIYITEPLRGVKEKYQTLEAAVVRNPVSFDPEDLRPFLAAFPAQAS